MTHTDLMQKLCPEPVPEQGRVCGLPMQQVPTQHGFSIDRCPAGHGVFLGRGELEKLMDAAAGHYGALAQQAPGAQTAQHGAQPHGYSQVPAQPHMSAPPAPSYGHASGHVQHHGVPQPHGGSHYGYHGHHKSKGHGRGHRRDGFLDEVFDGWGGDDE